MRLNFLAAAGSAILLVACNPVAQLDGAEQEIEAMQQLYNAGDHEGMYARAGQEFRDNSSSDQLAGMYRLFSDRLGDVVTSERAGFNVNRNLNELVTVVTMNTTFEKGEGLETYTFFGQDDDFRMVGWNVNSDDLIVIPPAGGEEEASAEAE